MLIKALCDYADKREKKDEEIIPDGWGKQDCSYMIYLTPDGEISGIADIRSNEPYYDKKGNEKTRPVPSKKILPSRTQKTAVDSNTIEHRPLYIFGLEFDKDGFSVSDKARKSHKAFVKHELEFFDGLDSEMCTAYRNFIEKWNPEAEKENPHLMQLGKDYKGSYFCFGLSGGKYFLEKDEQFTEKYNNMIAESKNINTDTENLPICAVLGERAATARIHDKIKFPGGNSTGCVLVGMKETAYESYGKTQSYNSNISEPAMKKYTSTMNMLLADKSHRIIIDDMVIVFFAMKNNDEAECGFFSEWFSESSAENAKKDASDTENNLNTMMKNVKGGTVGDISFAENIDENVMFYTAGFTPNSSRICQKFIYRDEFGKIIGNLVQHQKDMSIEGSKKEIKFSWIRKEMISPKSTDGKVPPPVMTSIILSAMNGGNYPDALLETTVRRVKTDSDEENNHFIKLNSTRAGIIKACINRKLRNSGKKEEIKMSLDIENKNQAYLCGRLFAVYEKIQKDSSGGDLNRTIKDSYFASACARPSAIMTKLSQLANNHLRKLDERSVIYYNKMTADIMDGLDGEFPQTLDLDSQGRFIVGYYQQNKALYTKSEERKDV